METEDTTIRDALEAERGAADQVIAWAKAQPKSWHRMLLLALVVLMVPAIIYGKMNATSGYFITTQLWSPITSLWHMVPKDLQHAFRGVMEGVFGGIAWQYFNLNAFKKRVLARWERYEDRLTFWHIVTDLFRVFLWASLGFAVGYSLLYANEHNAKVHAVLLALAPASWLHIHVNLAQLIGPATWAKLSAVFVSDLPLMAIGLVATHLGRPRITPVLWELQGYRAARAVLKNRPDRWYNLKGYRMRKQLFRILGNDAARQEVSEASRTVRIIVPMAMVASFFAFLGGLYIMLVIAQHATYHLGPIVLH